MFSKISSVFSSTTKYHTHCTILRTCRVGGFQFSSHSHISCENENLKNVDDRFHSPTAQHSRHDPLITSAECRKKRENSRNSSHIQFQLFSFSFSIQIFFSFSQHFIQIGR